MTSTNATDLTAYRDDIKAILEGSKAGPVKNLSIGNAVVLLEYIFVGSTRTVDILCRNLNPEAYDRTELIAAAKAFLVRGGRLRLLVQESLTWSDVRARVFVERMICHGRIGAFDIRLSDVASAQGAHNFAVGDSRHYRYEPDRTTTEAEADFNDPTRGCAFAKEFETLWSKAQGIPERPAPPESVRIVHDVDGDSHIFSAPAVFPTLLVTVDDPSRAGQVLTESARALAWIVFGCDCTYTVKNPADLDGLTLTRD
ncbi:MAG: hypothetical protein H7840_17345 [Alphaproteobacteria bacterium]